MSETISVRSLPKGKWQNDLNKYHHSLFIYPEWIEAVSDKNHIPVYLDIILNNITVAKISGLSLTNKRKGKYLYFYAGPAFKDYDQNIYNKCFDAILQFAKNNRYARIIIASYDNKHSYKYTGNKYYLTQRVEFIVPLYKSLNNIKFSQRFQRNKKRGEKINPEIRNSKESSNLSSLLRLLSSTHKVRVNKYNKNYNPFYLLNLKESTLEKLLLSGMGTLWFTYNNNSIDTMEFNLEKGNSVYMLLKGSNENAYKNGLPSFLSYNLITNYIDKNYKTYNLGGRVSGKGGDGLEIHKRSMGAEKITVYGATTNFLTYPYKLLNPILNIGRTLPQNNPLIKILKRFI